MPLAVRTEEPLARHTTLKTGGVARHFVVVGDVDELREALVLATATGLPWRILGGGSNLLVGDAPLEAVVIKNAIDGRRFAAAGPNLVHATIGAGEVLDDVIADTVARGLWGLENLSAIPGTVGATPVQNVGAYGVEVADRIASVEVLDATTGLVRPLTPADCRFGYRHSCFKEPEGAALIVTAVTFVLSRVPAPVLSYRDLALRFAGDSAPSLAAIRAAVVDIRAAKFPDWRAVGTAGSFFKNPIVPRAVAAALQARYPELPTYAVDDAREKLALGWILDHVCGLRGVRAGRVGTFAGQALVLVNDGGSAAEVASFAEEVARRVFDATGVTIEWEVTRW